jgi:hypothetical protein
MDSLLISESGWEALAGKGDTGKAGFEELLLPNVKSVIEPGS